MMCKGVGASPQQRAKPCAGSGCPLQVLARQTLKAIRAVGFPLPSLAREKPKRMN